MSSLPVYYVDAFTDAPFTGNPAAICLAEAPVDELRMRNLAYEIGFSETAFMWPEGESLRLRWFTPQAEVDLCGHATLAAAHILWEQGRLPHDQAAQFLTRSGTLTVTQNINTYLMHFPAEPAISCPCPAILPEALGQYPLYIAKNKFDYLVVLAHEDEVRDIRPDYELISRLRARGLIITAQANMEGYDFVSRFFAPAVGINEDPVTGSAHCCLGPYWADRLHKNELTGLQVSKRGGKVGVTVQDNQVILSGNCVTVLKGELLV